MIRLAGLPHVARFPKATVQRRKGRFEILFQGGEFTRVMDVDFRNIGEGEDLEGTELDLLAQLQRIGYAVERRAPEDEPEG